MRTKDRSAFGQRLFEARTHAKLSQEELARRADMRQTNLSHLERQGQGSAKVADLALACGVRVRWLAYGEGPMTGPESPMDAARVVASEAMPPYGAPNSARDYRAIVHTLADTLEQSGLDLTVKQFIALADATYKKIGRE